MLEEPEECLVCLEQLVLAVQLELEEQEVQLEPVALEELEHNLIHSQPSVEVVVDSVEWIQL